MGDIGEMRWKAAASKPVATFSIKSYSVSHASSHSVLSKYMTLPMVSETLRWMREPVVCRNKASITLVTNLDWNISLWRSP
jgi:hypothetical protein